MDRFSFLNTVHSSYIGDLYDRYLKNPDAIESGWRTFFQGFDFALEGSVSVKDTASGLKKGETTVSLESIRKEFQVIRLIDGYRGRGHLFTKTNPVRERRHYQPTLDIENFDLAEDDLDTLFDAGEILGIGKSSLRNIIKNLEDIYCSSIGVEYMYIRNPKEIEWIQTRLNENNNHPNFSAEKKKLILKKLKEAVSFESFLHTKYVGQKRFSLEGGESLIPALHTLVEESAILGVERFILGMAHRGRLNVLVNIFGKSPKNIFNEFDGKDYDVLGFDGDVKYHLGWTSNYRTSSGKSIEMDIVPNPSHLETVSAVVEGISRAKQDKYFPDNFSKVLPILIHGDAAISGQGISYEVVQMSKLEGYKTNGTVHIIINNQIGFTTNYLDGRSSIYCTDVAKVTLSPVLHVNADDVEAVVHAITFALKFRMKFKRDVFIDLLGYRKYGHNEGDEPRFTQPLLYKAIAKHKKPSEIYEAQLLKENIVDISYIKELESSYKKSLEDDLEESRQEEETMITPFMKNEWTDLSTAKEETMLEHVNTSYDVEKLNTLAKIITTLPEDKKFINKIKRIFKERYKMFFETNALDWAMAEQLSYASLLEEGFDIRFSGQDVKRGTFSHRHAVVKMEDSEEEIILLNKVDETHKLQIYNSLLSEYGVLGFDYGYAMTLPHTLVIWEAQFGDFSNGAQIIIDQYLSSSEDKWKIQNGMVMFLPHGFEGQGAEHSSARIERYLQLCAKDNMFVANCTTPSNLFHLLRRQMKVKYRKPLILFTPKSLLRHPRMVSTIEELSEGRFQMLIDDSLVKANKVKTLVFCTGKIYYDLLEKREELNRDDVALVRVEQLFPLPELQIDEIIEKYKNADDIVWAQEEPKNMGAYAHMLMHCGAVSKFRVASRRFYASPASGSTVRDNNRQREVIEYVFDKTKNNNIKKKTKSPNI